MSGIFGILRFDGSSPSTEELRLMAEANPTRGPDGTFFHFRNHFAAGISRLDTVQEAKFETLPHHDPGNGIVAVADVRLDNRDELLATLLPGSMAERTGDTELIAAAWQRWGEHCVEHLIGDFAFCIFDAHANTLFCARDRIGVKPFNYAWVDGKALIFGTDDIAVAAHPLCPRAVNEDRFADHLTGLFEGAEIEATFFRAVLRLPAAHVLTVKDKRLTTRRYWTFEPPEELNLESEQAYVEAFLSVFERAVRRRLRGGTLVGSMLSGGMDSGAICAIAAPIFKTSTGERFKTFSAIDGSKPDCVETAHVRASAGFLDVDSHFVDVARPDQWAASVADGFRHMGSPFDTSMNLVRAVFQQARESGCRVVLNGAIGDTALHAGGMVARAVRAGDWRTARTLFTEDTLDDTPFWRITASALIPLWLRRSARPLSRLWRATRIARESCLQPRPAAIAAIYSRLELFDRHNGDDDWIDAQRHSVASISHPNTVVALERYDRVAAEFGLETRDPFTDVEFLRFCASLPSGQKVTHAVRKAILRTAMRQRLPEMVIARTSKEHLGQAFSLATMNELGCVNTSLTTNVLGVLIRLPHCDMESLAPNAGECRMYWRGLETWLRRVLGTRDAGLGTKQAWDGF